MPYTPLSTDSLPTFQAPTQSPQTFQQQFGMSPMDFITFLVQQRKVAQEPKIASQEKLANMGYSAQQRLQAQAAQQALQNLQAQTFEDMKRRASEALLAQQPQILAEAARRQREAQMWSQPSGGYFPGGFMLSGGPSGYAGFGGTAINR